MTYYIELLCNNFHYQSVKTITDWLYPCSNEITDWEILNKIPEIIFQEIYFSNLEAMARVSNLVVVDADDTN